MLWYRDRAPIDGWEQAVDIVADRLLPGVGATEVRRTETVD
jgi:hypothetical protein